MAWLLQGWNRAGFYHRAGRRKSPVASWPARDRQRPFGSAEARSVDRVLLQRVDHALIDQVGALLDRHILASGFVFHPAHAVDLLAGDAAFLPPVILLA